MKKDFIDAFEQYLEQYLVEEYLTDEQSEQLTEGPFDIFKKKTLSPELAAYADAVRAGVTKADLVLANPRASLEKTFFDTVGGAQHQSYRLWNKCYILTCPSVSEDGSAITKTKSAEVGNFNAALSAVSNYAMELYNSGKVKAYKKVFGDLPMLSIICVKPEDCVSSEFAETFKKYRNMPRVGVFGKAFDASLADAMIVGVYDAAAKEGQEFKMPVRVREVFCNGLGEFTEIKGVARDPKTGEAR